MSRGEDRPPRVGLGLLKRAAIAFVLIAVTSGAAVASAGLLEIKDLTTTYTKARQGRQAIEIPEITRAEAGGPRTFLILGSDARYGDRKLGIKPRSDTILLIRVNPGSKRIVVMSIPRDLKVTIPGVGVDKINVAYEDGGPRKTVATVKRLFEDATGRQFPINNVINVNFGGFRRAVNYIGGVYVDVDRRYFNDNSSPGPEGRYATIDIRPGYQKLKGQDALDYVRYRHTDNDLIRAARQHDFLRQLSHQAGVRKLLNVSKRKQLITIFARYFDVDRSFLSPKTIIGLLKTAIYLTNKSAKLNEIRFPATESKDPAHDTYLYVSQRGLQRTFRLFMAAKGSAVPRPAPKATKADKAFRKLKRPNKPSSVKGLEQARKEGEDFAVLADPKLDFPFYFPALRLQNSRYAVTEPRIYTLKDEQGHSHQAYRLVLYQSFGEFYGVQGTTWKDPPILDDPDETEVVNGRRLRLYYDGKRVRLVAWRTKQAVYWVSNTLTQSLSKSEIVGIASSLRRLKQ